MKLRYRLVGLCCAAGILLVGPFSFAQSQRRGAVSVEEDPLEDRLPPGIKVRAFIHRPRVVEPNHLGTCTATTDATVTDYGLAGWHLPSVGITWKLNESSVPASVGSSAARAAVTSAFDTWSAADPQKIFVDGGSTTVKAAKFDGTNAILWKRLSPSTIGVNDVQDIATHEFGHWVGLDDLYSDADKDLTMYGFGAGGELKKRTLGTGDADGANVVAP